MATVVFHAVLLVVLFSFSSLEPLSIKDEFVGILKQQLENSNLTSASCPKSWVQHGSRCYYFSDDQRPWYQAMKSCNSKGARLVIISDCKENEFLKDYLTKHYSDVPNVDGWWTGGSDEALEGDWVWTASLTRIYFFDWCDETGEPNNYGGEQCLSLYPACGFKWNDRSCDFGGFRYICETYSSIWSSQNDTEIA